MAPHPAHFVHLGCALPLFCDSYTRNNKSTGHKNLRCFPHCCGAHRPNSFCGASIVVECPTARPTPATPIVSYCRFEASDMTEQMIQVDDVVSIEALAAEIKSTDVPLGPWMAGERLDVPSRDALPIVRFEFNRVRQSWHYGWRSNRFNCNIKHTFVVYVFEQLHGALRCVSRVSSPPFTICSTRRSSAKQPSSPSAASDEEFKAESSPQRKRSRTVKSSQPTNLDTMSPHLNNNNDHHRDSVDGAIQEMLLLAEIYARCGVVDKVTLRRLDIPSASSTYAVLLDLLEHQVFTPATTHFIQGHLDHVDVSLHESFRQLVWFIWNQVSHALEARHLTVRELVGSIQLDFPWCELSPDHDAWLHHYTTLAAEVKKTASTARDSLTTFLDQPRLRKPIFGRWQRETPVRHCQLVQQHLLERGSRIWTCMEGAPSTVQMRWECAVFAPWMTFRLDELPQSHPHQLVGPSGLPTLGSGMQLCGTRAWEENQGDTLVVEWYFWPEDGLPRKRVRERFTLLASTTNSMMSQQFVELCWDKAPDTVSGSDVLQRVLLPANWQVHHIETSYYLRIG